MDLEKVHALTSAATREFFLKEGPLKSLSSSAFRSRRRQAVDFLRHPPRSYERGYRISEKAIAVALRATMRANALR